MKQDILKRLETLVYMVDTYEGYLAGDRSIPKDAVAEIDSLRARVGELEGAVDRIVADGEALRYVADRWVGKYKRSEWDMEAIDTALSDAPALAVVEEIAWPQALHTGSRTMNVDVSFMDRGDGAGECIDTLPVTVVVLGAGKGGGPRTRRLAARLPRRRAQP